MTGRKANNNKKIVTAAITGANHTPGMSEHLPYGKEGIIRQAVDALDAGAAIVHIHSRDEVGMPSPDKQRMHDIIAGIKAQRPNGIIAISTGGGLNMTVEERFSVIENFKPEMASCNCGTMNFSLADMEGLVTNPKYDWEIPFLRASADKVFKNTYKDMSYCIDTMNKNGTLPEYEVFDLGQIDNVAYYKRRGLITQPIYLQIVLGVRGGAALTLENLFYMINYARKVLGEDFKFSTVAGGRRHYRYEAAMAIAGGNIRVGMEDSLYLSPNGEQAVSNAQQVEKMISILKALDYEIATSDEAREMLSLKGANNVGF